MGGLFFEADRHGLFLFDWLVSLSVSAGAIDLGPAGSEVSTSFLDPHLKRMQTGLLEIGKLLQKLQARSHLSHTFRWSKFPARFSSAATT